MSPLGRQRPARLDVLGGTRRPVVARGRRGCKSRLRAHPALPAKPGRESIEASGSVDVKTLNNGRKGTSNGWAAAESAVTESVYERSVTKDAQNRIPEKSGSVIPDEVQ